VSRAIADIIERAESTITEECPAWLTRLALAWRSELTSIATLNYNLLPERAMTQLGGLHMAFGSVRNLAR
jgi:hypothetical protein